MLGVGADVLADVPAAFAFRMFERCNINTEERW
jgi:hypothetical protein